MDPVFLVLFGLLSAEEGEKRNNSWRGLFCYAVLREEAGLLAGELTDPGLRGRLLYESSGFPLFPSALYGQNSTPNPGQPPADAASKQELREA